MQSWSAMPVIDFTGRSLHYLYSSWLNATPYAWQMLLNQFSNFVWCLFCNQGTDKQMLSTPEHVQPTWQGCPLTLGIKTFVAGAYLIKHDLSARWSLHNL